MFRSIFTLILVVLLSACGYRATKPEVVYKDNYIVVQLPEEHYYIEPEPTPPVSREDMKNLTPTQLAVVLRQYALDLRTYSKTLILQIKAIEKASNEMTERMKKEYSDGK